MKVCLVYVCNLLLLASSHVVKENVVFQELGEVYTTRSYWKVTFIEDLSMYESMMETVSSQLKDLNGDLMQVVSGIDSKSSYQLWNNFRTLMLEFKSVDTSFLDLKREFESFKMLSIKSRQKRSVLPFVGSISSLLFGTVSEAELAVVERSISSLTVQQSEIVHVVEESLSMLNISRAQISTNRQRLNELIDTVRQLSDELGALSGDAEKQVLELSRSISTYLRCKEVLDKTKQNIEKLSGYFQYLQMQLNMLSVGHLSPSVITPGDFKKLLINLKAQIPLPFKLPEDPSNNLWHYYKQLQVATVLHQNSVLIIVKVPLIDVNSKFELFKIHNLPFPGGRSLKTMTAKYDVESPGLAVNAARTEYMLMNNKEMARCVASLDSHCQLNRPAYLFSAGIHCVASLFTRNAKLISKNCKAVVSPNALLPVPVFLSHATWAIATSEGFKMSMICGGKNTKTTTVKPPITIVSLNETCYATSNYFNIQPRFQFDSKVAMTSHLPALSKIDFSNITIWEPVKSVSKSNNTITIPDKLKDVESIPMQHLVDKLKALNTPTPTLRKTSVWYYYLLLAIGIVMVTGSVTFYIKRYLEKRRILHVNANNVKGEEISEPTSPTAPEAGESNTGPGKANPELEAVVVNPTLGIAQYYRND